MVEKWSFYVWRYSSRFTHYFLWSESDYLWCNSYFSKSSSIDLIFTNPLNLVTESGVCPSLHLKCDHQIVFAKLNLNVEYPPLYERLIWDYKNADISTINRAIEIFDWWNLCKGKNVHEQVHFFNITILNIFHNYSHNKTILCNDKDAPWFNNEIRKILTKKNEIFKQYIANRKSVAIDQ